MLVANYPVCRLLAADAPKLRQAAYAVRHEAYFSQGYIDPRPNRLFSDADDHRPNCRTFVVEDDDQIVGSIRTCVHKGRDEWDHIPAQVPFAKELQPWVTRGMRLCELNRFVVSPRHQSGRTIAKLALFASAVITADEQDCDFMVAAVRETDSSFYEHLHFRQIAEPRPYPHVKFNTALMVMDWRASKSRLQQHRLFRRVWDFID